MHLEREDSLPEWWQIVILSGTAWSEEPLSDSSLHFISFRNRRFDEVNDRMMQIDDLMSAMKLQKKSRLAPGFYDVKKKLISAVLLPGSLYSGIPEPDRLKR
jgi:hypothetical protein